ncbi:AAA family ATPase [Aphanothece sacrum]|uniref:gluconokinase n=1 Tax=Aphanothece sacrum FPU1 TaxID=1920663 RepID=A0A401IKP9_APHSA|nr:bifunctional aminoglycoside phosphotransferase/ATP-binding protein [Aphanothece sacrum]GBF81811.1 aminoglycoside phosphotransferase [Aphanothece sacrum FPU1]GBF84343.1 aminoglycoside phosphotransferase [Aphanothece sacrum FPU3]
MNQFNLSTLIEQLKQPQVYPHSVQIPIEVIQTHASAVFLTGDYAYKIKKSVNFGFLDYSTLEKREYFLTQELLMNREIAPDLYLEVLPITLSNNYINLSGEGEIIDYILKMRQFPQDCLFINLFNQGKLTSKHLEDLGKIVAHFHKTTKTNSYISSFGEIPMLKKSIEDNYHCTKPYIGIAQTQQQYQKTKEFTDRFLSDKPDIFKNRQQQDKIRECHGDLHLKNICLWNNKIQLFDRIEFNEEFRFVDVIYDVAFTIMDLDAKRRQDLSNIFLNTYLQETGDWEALQVLPLYLCRQAYVRAKVNSMLLNDPQICEQEKQQALTIAKNYYDLAAKYTKKRQSCIILMSGMSGSGKSTIAQYIARQINAIHIRSDAVRKHLGNISLKETGADELYTPSMNQKTYHRLLDLGLMVAQQGFPVILDAKFDRHQWRETIINLAQEQQIPLHIIYCQAPISVLFDRLSQRTGDISDATPNLLQQQQAVHEPFNETEQKFLQSFDTTENWQTSVDAWLNSELFKLVNCS